MCNHAAFDKRPGCFLLSKGFYTFADGVFALSKPRNKRREPSPLAVLNGVRLC